MTPSWLLVLSLATALVPLGACGGKVVFDDGSGGSSSVVVGPSVGASTHAVGVTSSATGSGGKLDITLVSTQFFTDCKPEVPSDPLGGSFTAKYQNDGGSAASANVAGAVLHIDAAAADYSFDVDPAGSGPIAPGQSIEVMHKKISGSGSSTSMIELCNFCGSSGVLQVTWTNGQSAVLPIDQLGCGF